MATRKTNRRTTPKTTSKPVAEQKPPPPAASDPGPTELGADGELAKAQAKLGEGPGPELTTEAVVKLVDYGHVTVTPEQLGWCKVAGCKREPAHRGLCPAHWMTHRGEADPVGGA